MMKIYWMDKISNEEVLAQVNVTGTMLNSTWARKHHLYLCVVQGRSAPNHRKPI